MPRVLFVIVIALCSVLFPVVAKADTIDLVNRFGSVTILDSGITSRGSELVSFGGLSPSKGHAFGRVNFTTGALMSGSLWTGGTFSSLGSTFDVIGRGRWMKQMPGLFGEKGNTALFTGAFTGTISWTLVSSKTFFREYQLSGTIQGMLWNGTMVSGQTTQIINTHWGPGRTNNQGSIQLGMSGLDPGASQSTPEPGTLGLVGTGLLGMVGKLLRRMSKTSDV